MAQKINANALRLGINKDWKSVWYADGDDYTEQLHQDLEVRKVIEEMSGNAGIDDVKIMRSTGKMEIHIFVARPGVAIGRGGSGIEELSNKIRKIVNLNKVEIKINEVKRPELSARIIASDIAKGLERRVPPKILARNALQKAMSSGANGIRIWVAGRINGAPQARTVKYSEGAVPLHTLKADIDHCVYEAHTKDLGILGVKVWVYREDSKTTK